MKAEWDYHTRSMHLLSWTHASWLPIRLDGLVQRLTTKAMSLLALEKGPISQQQRRPLDFFNLVYLHHQFVNAITALTVAMTGSWLWVRYQWFLRWGHKARLHYYCHTIQPHFNVAYITQRSKAPLKFQRFACHSQLSAGDLVKED